MFWYCLFQKVNAGCENTLKYRIENESESHNYHEHSANAAASVHYLTQWRNFTKHDPSTFATIWSAAAIASQSSRQRRKQQPKQGSQWLLQRSQLSWVSLSVFKWINFSMLLGLRVSAVHIFYWASFLEALSQIRAVL